MKSNPDVSKANILCAINTIVTNYPDPQSYDSSLSADIISDCIIIKTDLGTPAFLNKKGHSKGLAKFLFILPILVIVLIIYLIKKSKMYSFKEL
jgi:hypothetical protein